MWYRPYIGSHTCNKDSYPCQEWQQYIGHSITVKNPYVVVWNIAKQILMHLFTHCSQYKVYIANTYMKSAVSNPLSTHRYNKKGVKLSHELCIFVPSLLYNKHAHRPSCVPEL